MKQIKKTLLLAMLLCTSVLGYSQTFNLTVTGKQYTNSSTVEIPLLLRGSILQQELVPQLRAKNRFTCSFNKHIALPEEFTTVALRELSSATSLSAAYQHPVCDFVNPLGSTTTRDQNKETLKNLISELFVDTGVSTPFVNKKQ